MLKSPQENPKQFSNQPLKDPLNLTFLGFTINNGKQYDPLSENSYLSPKKRGHSSLIQQDNEPQPCKRNKQDSISPATSSPYTLNKKRRRSSGDTTTAITLTTTNPSPLSITPSKTITTTTASQKRKFDETSQQPKLQEEAHEKDFKRTKSVNGPPAGYNKDEPAVYNDFNWWKASSQKDLDFDY